MASGKFIAAVRDHEQDLMVGDATAKDAKKIEASGVRPVQIFQNEHQRPVFGRGFQELPDLLRGAHAGFRIRRRLVGSRRTSGRGLSRLRRQTGGSLHPRSVGRCDGQVVAAAFEDETASAFGFPSQPLDQRSSCRCPLRHLRGPASRGLRAWRRAPDAGSPSPFAADEEWCAIGWLSFGQIRH